MALYFECRINELNALLQTVFGDFVHLEWTLELSKDWEGRLFEREGSK